MKPPAFQLYADDFLAGTDDMTAEEVGVYIRLLCHQWSKDGLPNDNVRLGLMAKCLSEQSLNYVKAKFDVCEDGKLRNKRLESVRRERSEFLEQCSASGRKGGGNPNFKKGNPNPYLHKGQDKGIDKGGDKGLINSPVSSLQSPNKERGSQDAALPLIFDEWNKTPGVSQCLLISDKRRNSLKVRLGERFFADNWKAALAKVAQSSFCKGVNERGWKASFDWFISRDAVTRIMEGKYDDRTGTTNKPNSRNAGIIVGPTNYATAKTKFDREREAKELAAQMASDECASQTATASAELNL